MTVDAITIRPAKRADVAAIVKLLADDPLGQSRERIEQPLPESYYKAFEAIQRAHAIQMVVAEDGDGQIVGCLQLAILPALSSQGAFRGLIEDVRVASDRRNQGIGERLVRWAIGEALANGCKLLELFSHESRVDAQRFYKSVGFQASHVGMTMRF